MTEVMTHNDALGLAGLGLIGLINPRVGFFLLLVLGLIGLVQ